MSAGEVIPLAKDAFIYLNELIKSYSNLIPEAKEFRRKCDMYRMMIIKDGNSETEKIAVIIKEKLNEADEKACILIQELNNVESYFKKIKIQSKLFFKDAVKYNEYFKDCKEEMIIEIKMQLKFKNTVSPERIVSVPSIARHFWEKYFSDKDIVTWNEFKIKYSIETGIKDINNLETYLCGGKYVTKDGFFNACSRFGYPIMVYGNLTIDTVKLAQLVMDIVKEFYAPDFSKSWIYLRDLYFQNKNNYYEYLSDIGKNEKNKWNEINKNKIIVFSLFQRYYLVMNIAKESRDMFSNMSFPGNSRTKLFLKMCEVIDEVNFKEVLRLNQEKEWKAPKIYTYLKDNIY
jgi:hypothetical protein